MKITCISLCCLSLEASLPAVYAAPVNQITGGGPETTLDSTWAGAGHLRTLTETVSSQIGLSRFQDDGNSRLWSSGLASFGNASVRNNHPAFDYSAGGYALGYDYCQYESGIGLLGGAAFGNMFGHQNIEEMPDHPDGRIPGDRYRQVSLSADFYGAALVNISPRSHLIFSMDAGFSYMENKCQHRDEWDMSRWNTDTFLISFSTAWRYDVTESLSVTPFTKLSYTHSSNKEKRENGYSYCSDHHEDDDCYDNWDNRGKLDNLSLEMGLTLEHAIRFSQGTVWTNSLSGSYCPDILRKNPHYTFKDTWWEGDTMYESRYRGQGYPSARQAFKVGFLSRLACNENVSLFASYQVSLRESYTEQQATLGVSFSF